MPSVLCVAVNEYAGDPDTSGSSSRTSPQRDSPAAQHPGMDTSLLWTPMKGTHCLAGPELGPAFASATGNSFKLGRDGGGTQLCSQTFPAGIKRLQTWRVAGRGSAKAKGCTQALGTRKTALLLLAISTMFLMIAVNSAVKMHGRNFGMRWVMSTGNKGDVPTSFCMCRQGKNGWQGFSSCRNAIMILGAKSFVRLCCDEGLD